MKKLFLLFITFLVSLICLDFFVGILAKPMLLNEPDASNNHSNLKQSLFDKKADIVILGASKANHHYIPDSLQSHFGMAVYNTGVDGDNIVTSRVQFDAMFDRHAPRIVIIDLSAGQMADEWENYFLSHKCYYGLNNKYTSFVNDHIPLKQRVKLYCNLYKLNESVPDIIQSYLKGNTTEKGYIPMYGSSKTLNHISKSYMNDTYEMGLTQKECLSFIIKKCKENDISVYVVYSPTLITYTNGVTQSIDSYCKKNQVPFINYEGDTTYVNHPELFRDYNHLNVDGARIFTRDFINRIKIYENNE